MLKKTKHGHKDTHSQKDFGGKSRNICVSRAGQYIHEHAAQSKPNPVLQKGENEDKPSHNKTPENCSDYH